MERRTLDKEKVPALLAALQSRYRVVAPQRVGPHDVVYDDWAPAAAIPYDFVNSVLPPKSHFFLERENLLTIRGSKRPVLEPPPQERPVCVFGMRSCDATGLSFLHAFYAGRGFNDGTVTGRVERSLRITLACTTPGPDCFCVCCEGGPFLTEHFDLQAVDMGTRLLVEVGTDKGASVVEENRALFGPATEEDVAWKRAQVDKVDSLFQRRTYLSAGTKRVSLGKPSDEAWDTLAEDCRACGGCCHVCPTCSCFTVNDVEVAPDTYHRERTWDACLHEGFTREASGHNPRHHDGQRLKRRFFHKMSYQYVERMGRHGCVGCGRCEATCLGTLGISSILERFKHVDATR
jgi:ferredoxin